MNRQTSGGSCEKELEMTPQEFAGQQRSHVLFVLSNALKGHEVQLEQWYQGTYKSEILKMTGLLGVRHYKQEEIDLMGGHYPIIPFKYLGIHDICIDGGQAAEVIIDRITEMHTLNRSSFNVATWLYFPICEKVGRSPRIPRSGVTLAFANGLPGRELEFREWYVTRHIRHALNIAAFVSGQCFERSLFQKTGTLESGFALIAMYEQEGSADSILESIAALPPNTFEFPAIDEERTRFSESAYRAI